MTDARVRLRPAGDVENGLGYVETLLERAGLPADDVRSGPGQFYVADEGPDRVRVGVGGIEVHGTLYLLTTTAAGFFADRGYERTDRSAASPAVRRTAQFAELCPATAACLRKPL